MALVTNEKHIPWLRSGQTHLIMIFNHVGSSRYTGSKWSPKVCDCNKRLNS